MFVAVTDLVQRNELSRHSGGMANCRSGSSWCYASASHARLVLSWPSDVRFYVIVCERILFGLFFIFAAPKSRLPQFMYAIGGITLLAGIAFIFLGSHRLEAIVRWMFIQPNLFIQTMYAVAVLFGALLVF